MLDRIEALPVPVVCCIHGYCLGGGLELALACHCRIATRDDGTRLGFPEVRLGMFPGFNGTWRSIRQAGALSAMQTMLPAPWCGQRPRVPWASSISCRRARRTCAWAARKAIERGRKSKPAGGWRALLRHWPIRPLLAGKLRSETGKKAREDHYPAPFRLIDFFERTAAMSGR